MEGELPLEQRQFNDLREHALARTCWVCSADPDHHPYGLGDPPPLR